MAVLSWDANFVSFVAFLLCYLLDVADFLTFCALVVGVAQTGMWF